MLIIKIQVKLLYSIHSTFDTSDIKLVNYTYMYLTPLTWVSLKQVHSIQNTFDTSDMYNIILILIFQFCKAVWPSRLAGLWIIYSLVDKEVWHCEQGNLWWQGVSCP